MQAAHFECNCVLRLCCCDKNTVREGPLWPSGSPTTLQPMIELLTTAEMVEADRLAIAGGVAGIDLMENAGREVARSVDHHLDRHVRGKGKKASIIVIAGPGNNGGD